MIISILETQYNLVYVRVKVRRSSSDFNTQLQRKPEKIEGLEPTTLCHWFNSYRGTKIN